jgi:hypothetical protein
MSAPSNNPADNIKVVAVAIGANARWSWRIFMRNGRILQESPDTFANVADALADGRRHVAEIASSLPAIEAVEPSRRTEDERREPLVALPIRQAEHWC